MEANQDTGATTVDGAASRLSQLLNRSEPTPPTDPEEAHNTETESAGAETPEGDTEQKPTKYKVSYKGQDEELTLEELIKGNMMERDYRHKTSELGDQRRALEEKAKKLDESLNDARLLLEEEVAYLDSPEMKELEQIDPDSYLKEMRRVQRKVERFNKRKAEREQELAYQNRELAMKEREAMLRAIPDWLDEGKMADEGAKVLGSLKTVGYNDQEIASLIDHRMMVLARKAFLYDQISSAKPDGKKVTQAPKVAKPGTVVDQSTISSKKTDQLKAKLQQSGRRDDAAALIKQMLIKG